MLKRIILLSFLVCGCGCTQDAGPSKAPQPETVPYEQFQEAKDLVYDYAKENKKAADLIQKMNNDINVFVNELKAIKTDDPELDKVLAKYNIKRDTKQVPPKKEK